MKVIIDMENLENIVESALNKNVEQAVKEAAKEEVRNKVNEVLKEKIEEIVNSSIESYINEYIKTAKVQVGDSWKEEEIKEYTVEQYLKLKITDIFENKSFEIKKKDSWGGYTKQKISFQEYLDEKLIVDSDVKRRIDEMAKNIKSDVSTKIRSLFNDSMRNILAENMFEIIAASDNYKKISNSLKLLGE